jgi:hypothetical protein
MKTYELIQIFHEHLIHEVHEVGGCIGQSKGHNCVLVRKAVFGMSDS